MSKISTVRAIAEDCGFAPVDRFLQLVLDLDETAFVIYNRDGVAVEVDGTGLCTPESAKPSAEWLSRVDSQTRLLVMLVAQQGAAEAELRQLMGAKKAFGGYAATVPIRAKSRYTLLSRDGEEELVLHDHCVFLDSNVLVHLEKMARGTSRDTDRDKQVQQLATRIAHRKVLGGAGIAELSWSRSQSTWDSGRASSLRATIDAWFNGGIKQTRDVEAVRMAYRDSLARNANSADTNFGRPYELQLAYYTCLLKIAQLWSQAGPGYRENQRLDLYEAFAHWMLEEFGYNLSHALLIARDRFVGPQDSSHVGYVDQLMKFGKDPIRNLWGAAWDLTHLAHIDQSIHPGFSKALDIENKIALLATDDKALPKLRARIQFGSMIMDGSYSLSLVQSEREKDKRLANHQGPIDSVDSWLSDQTLSRQVGPQKLEYWLEVSQRAENEFLEIYNQEGVYFERAAPKQTVVPKRSSRFHSFWRRKDRS